MKKDLYEKNLISALINFLLYIFKWLCLCFCVVNVALTIGLIVLALFSHGDLANVVLGRMLNYIAGLEPDAVMDLVQSVGKVKVMVAGAGYGFASSLTFGITYVLVTKFKVLLDSIFKGEMYTKSNVELINGALPYTLILAFGPAVVMYVIVEMTNVFDLSKINVSGIIYVCICYVLKLLFEKGYSIERANDRHEKQINDIKAREEELKLETLKTEAELKELKAEATAARKEAEKAQKEAEAAQKEAQKAQKVVEKTKKVEEKVEAVKEEKPAKKAPAKKAAAKKTATKKAETVKEPVKKVAAKKTTKKTTK